MCNCNKSKLAPKIYVKYFNDDQPRLEKLDQGDWIDLIAAETIEFKQFDFKLVPLGVAMKLPEGCEGHMLPRSSTFKKWGIIMANSMGIIDESYCGNNDQWHFPALAIRGTIINKGDRICQFRIVEKMVSPSLPEVVYLVAPDRGGFGTTGHN